MNTSKYKLHGDPKRNNSPNPRELCRKGTILILKQFLKLKFLWVSESLTTCSEKTSFPRASTTKGASDWNPCTNPKSGILYLVAYNRPVTQKGRLCSYGMPWVLSFTETIAFYMDLKNFATKSCTHIQWHKLLGRQ